MFKLQAAGDTSQYKDLFAAPPAQKPALYSSSSSGPFHPKTDLGAIGDTTTTKTTSNGFGGFSIPTGDHDWPQSSGGYPRSEPDRDIWSTTTPSNASNNNTAGSTSSASGSFSNDFIFAQSPIAPPSVAFRTSTMGSGAHGYSSGLSTPTPTSTTTDVAPDTGNPKIDSLVRHLDQVCHALKTELRQLAAENKRVRDEARQLRAENEQLRASGPAALFSPSGYWGKDDGFAHYGKPTLGHHPPGHGHGILPTPPSEPALGTHIDAAAGLGLSTLSGGGRASPPNTGAGARKHAGGYSRPGSSVAKVSPPPGLSAPDGKPACTASTSFSTSTAAALTSTAAAADPQPADSGFFEAVVYGLDKGVSMTHIQAQIESDPRYVLACLPRPLIRATPDSGAAGASGAASNSNGTTNGNPSSSGNGGVGAGVSPVQSIVISFLDRNSMQQAIASSVIVDGVARRVKALRKTKRRTSSESGGGIGAGSGMGVGVDGGTGVGGAGMTGEWRRDDHGVH